ncbi:hypothetical protein AGABI1DRAFT_46869 [Agaricus bisporus var. burnettii JB137-S8]|uniref:Uncharacterized protein n=1 Tax=Agaricus bisporus var. burnettii (strain JB137-S8 / ATCC MYA-4627 / FGSC 10392) TaxID=597362 RepID=K5WX76_AGABU|nr:uncharacterized protein AGABI1DRAFT_46869 [Agaricus bisporus var. burnettii JB137-S8]EKM75172.1 hypothetical protein AGABI1DRAFT_46869 [Agaricus bisporus var. burnettii JB137-S8]
MIWFYSSTTKTLADLDRLVYSVITAPDFKPSDFEDFSAVAESKRLDNDPNSEQSSAQAPFTSNDVWHTSTVSIPLPLTGRKHPSEDKAPKLDVEFHHRDLVEVVKSAAQDHNSEHLHWKGYKTFWKSSAGEPSQRVYGEAYTSDFFLELEEEITPVEGCNLETVIIALFLYSDATLLANFGDLSLWPIYVWLGNLSKYIRGKTRSFTAHHLAYLPSLPDLVHDVYKSVYEASPTSSILTFLKRELIQAIWRHLLNDEFKNAHKYGIIVKCKDGQFRRFYPRFFVYSADYPEKTLLASIKQKGKWLCTLCKIKTDQILQLGTKLHDLVWSTKFRVDSTFCARKIDEARKWIFERGIAVDSDRINDHLGESLVPVKNAFSGFLSPMNQNYFELFARDLMHEFELGVWKAVFTHLIRMLYTYRGDAIAELNHR